jgi:hypothetical protein
MMRKAPDVGNSQNSTESVRSWFESRKTGERVRAIFHAAENEVRIACGFSQPPMLHSGPLLPCQAYFAPETNTRSLVKSPKFLSAPPQ